MALADPLAVFEAVCVRHSIILRVVVTKQIGLQVTTHTTTLCWDDFIQIANCRAVADFAAAGLFNSLDRHRRSACKCQDRVLFRASGYESSGSSHGEYPDSIPQVPLNSPVEGGSQQVPCLFGNCIALSIID